MKLGHVTKQAWQGAVVLAVLIALLVAHTVAAGDFFFEAESGALSGQASSLPDATASSGQFLQFNSGSTGATPLPNPGTWVDVTGNLGNISNFWVRSWAVPNSSTVLTGMGVGGGGIFSTTGGNTWTKLGSGSGSASIDIMPQQILFDPANSNTFWVAGMYGNPTGLYKTTNGGQTFTKLSDMGHDDDIGVDFTDPNRQTLIVVGHEQHNSIFKSTNGGQTWTSIGANFPSGAGITSAVHVINAQTYIIQSGEYGPGNFGMYRTTNGGQSWTRQSTDGTMGPFTLTSTGALFARGGANWGHSWNYIVRSTDNGITWTRITGQEFSTAPVELPDGRLIVGNQTRLLVSSDNGSTWTPFGAPLPCLARGIAYSSGQQAIYINGDENCSGGPRVYRLR